MYIFNVTKSIILGIILLAIVIAVVFILKKNPSQKTTVSEDVDAITPLPVAESENEKNSQATNSSDTKTATTSSTITPTPATEKLTELKIEDIKIGTGAEAVAGKKITVNYKGTLVNGVQFDSSYDRGQPFSFVLGAGQVIQGWDQGFAGMKVGDKRKLTIPPSLGYGSRAMGSIPPNSILIFEVELLKVE